jgi:large subunit ribosomal protein L10
LRALGVEYNVVKNRLAIRATKELDFPVDEALFRLPTGIIFSYDEPLTPAKTLVDYGKKLKDRLPIKAAVIEGQTYLADDAKRFASVPGKQELLSKVVGSLQSPVSGLVGTMQALVRELVGVLDAVKDKRQAEEDA